MKHAPDHPNLHWPHWATWALVAVAASSLLTVAAAINDIW
jgi:hypothetical protein